MAPRLPIPVRRVLREPISGDAVDRAWARRQLAPPRPRAAIAAGAAIAIAAAGLLAVIARHRDHGPLELAGGALPSELEGRDARSFALSDGSTIELSEEGAIAVARNDGRSFSVELRDGRSTFDVTPGGPRTWTIECGLATVVVLGTRFTIDRTLDRLVVSVERGRVSVRGDLVPDRGRELGAGESITIEAELVAMRSLAAAAPPASIPPPAIEDPTPVAPVEAAPPAPRPAARPRAWRALAERGAYDDAYAELGPDGVRRAASGASAEDLLALADVARLSGHAAEAVEPLEAILDRHGADPSAPLAAFTLGTVEADQLRRPERAARAFDRALELGLPRSLRADALARLARARGAIGDDEGARDAARRYLEHSPDGPRARAMREIAEGVE